MGTWIRYYLAQSCYVLGPALALYLALLKWFTLPCVGPGNCLRVIHSSFGSVYGLPVGLFGALLWYAAILIPNRTKRSILLLILTIGCAGFIFIQFYALRTLCLWCTLHAIVVWLAFWLRFERPARWVITTGVLLAASAFLATKYLAPAVPRDIAHARPDALLSSRDGLKWLGKTHAANRALVLSLDCPACLDLLASLSRHSFDESAAGTAIFLKTSSANAKLTTVFVAAVLSQESPPRDAFLAVSSILLSEKDLVLTAPDQAALRLAAIFPAAELRRPLAEQILKTHAASLAAAKLGETTPLLIIYGQDPKAIFSLEALFSTSAR